MFQFSINNRLFITAVFLIGALNSMSLCCQEEIEQGSIEALATAIIDNNFDTALNLIITQPQLVNAHLSSSNGDTPLHVAAALGRQAIAATLIAHGANLDARNQDGKTPLHRAAQWGNQNTVAVLIAKGARADATDRIGNPVRFVPVGDTTPLADTNLRNLMNEAEYTKYVSIINYYKLYNAIRQNNINEVERLISSHRPLVNAYDPIDGDTPLHVAAAGDNPAIAATLITHGANLQTRNKKERIPLHNAAASNNIELVALLIAKGAASNAVDRNGQTPAHVAAYEGRIEALKILLTQPEVTINEKCGSGWTLLHLAAYRGHFDIVTFLVKDGADANDRTSQDHTPLDLARQEGCQEIVKLLQHHGTGSIKQSLSRVWKKFIKRQHTK